MRRIPLPFDDERPKEAIASLVDIAFLLLIFFVVATTILPRESDLPMSVPESEAGVLPNDASIVELNARSDGSVWWGSGAAAMRVDEGDGTSELPQLREMLRSAVEGLGAERVMVDLSVEENVRQQRFIDVLDALVAEGVTRIAMRD